MIGKVEALITIPSTGLSFSLTHSVDGSASIDLTAANTYYHSSAGNDSNDLPAALKALLDAVGSAVYTVTCDATVGGTGKYTISVDSGTFDISWTDTVLRDLLGYTSNLSTQTSATGADQARGLWLPGAPSNKNYGSLSPGKPRSAASVRVAPDGTYYAYHGPKMRADVLDWNAVQVERVILAHESTTNESFERLWLDAIRGEASWSVPGKSFRWYADADTDGTYLEYHVINATEPTVQRLDSAWDGLWSVRLEVLGA